MKTKDEKKAREALIQSVYDQVYEALDNATHGNGYEHEWHLSHLDTVLQINDWSGIEGFDEADTDLVNAGHDAVIDWRKANPK